MQPSRRSAGREMELWIPKFPTIFPANHRCFHGELHPGTHDRDIITTAVVKISKNADPTT
jgi:hypothetical protein